MVLLNNATEWKKVKSEIEKDLSDMGEYGRVIRCHRDPYGKFHGASIECGLNRATKSGSIFLRFCNLLHIVNWED